VAATAAIGLLDPESERLIEESRERLDHRLDRRERTGEALAAGAFLAVATAMAVLLPWERSLEAPLALALVVAYAVASRVRFEVGPCYTDPSQLVLVPMLFLLPPAVVPLLVAAASVAGGLPDYVQGRRHAERAVLSLSDSFYAVGPALVLALASAGEPTLADWPLYLGALGAQFACDLLANTPRLWFELGLLPRAQLRDAAWTFAVDAPLAGAGLLVALAVSDDPYAFVLVLPLMALLAIFAKERERRVDMALELSDAYRGTTMVLADLVETDDEYTGVHSRTVVSLSQRVAEEMGLDARQRRSLEFGALLHDVGKIAVPKEIINKPGPLSPDEWALIRLHTIDGQRLLDRVGGVLQDVGRIVRSSHERWDGTGYPDGLAGEDIPVEARIVACCDAFNAMTTHRSYRTAMSVEVALDELRDGAGSQFDPEVVRSLLRVLEAAPELAAAVPELALVGA
jgi:HD-GYP domain-containing protein (c-di-GMP phosphodiesterase class II)